MRAYLEGDGGGGKGAMPPVVIHSPLRNSLLDVTLVIYTCIQGGPKWHHFCTPYFTNYH